MKIHEIRISGYTGGTEAIARLLCPVEEHDGPCEVPWSLAAYDGDVVLGICADQRKAEEIADRVRVFGPVELSEGDPSCYEGLVEQYRIEKSASR
ncbi:hypothetical protein NLX83_27015 [Allokutzneria sp. A3M-2-11 16]|uniref:hypothetical protein n=1 Tax=Allokutzneria sp. A3M-2-11 16 TaxID=2962043 RepID=UPI0020B77A17|nr:hypothetical protein [Allokutzneria sp. A3M-2-11 16]MCP3802932.1 hypothetical protein [Allokutzneria sp. A3M-2-11 16]